MQFPQSSYHQLSHTLLQIIRYHSTKCLFRQPIRLYLSGIPERQMLLLAIRNKSWCRFHHHHHHVPEGLGVFPVPRSSRWSWSLHLFLGRPIFLLPFGLYCSACFGSLFVSILCTCCSHFFWYCFISFTMFCAPVFRLIHWFISLSSFVIPSKCLTNFIWCRFKILNVIPFNLI